MDDQEMRDAIVEILNAHHLDVSPSKFRSLHRALAALATRYKNANPYVVALLGPPQKLSEDESLKGPQG